MCIRDRKYAFNKNGEMLSGLQALKLNAKDEIIANAGIDTDKMCIRDRIKTINGKKYIFNENGEMMTGLIAVQFAKDSTTELATYVEDNKVKYVYEKLGDADEVDDNYYNVASTVKGKKLDDADKKVAVYLSLIHI